jgi:iron complex transport system ATP-binding protein
VDAGAARRSLGCLTENAMTLELRNITKRVEGETHIDGVSLTLDRGSLNVLLGPTLAGKTTLLRCLSMALVPQRGPITLNGKSVTAWSRGKIARFFGVVPQSPSISFPFSVLDVVMMGRTPHLRRFQQEGQSDYEIAREAMRLTSVEALYGRPVSELSGGEVQRVVIARALAQQPHVLLLDEPTSQLDINHQMEVMHLVRTLARKKGIIVIIISHDLNLSMRYCDKLLLLSEGRVYEHGPPEAVVTEASLEKVYGVAATVAYNAAIRSHQVTILDVISSYLEGTE